MTLFERVKETAKSRGYSLAELSRKADIGEKTIYTWKPSKTYPNGVTPSHEVLEKVAKVLNVTVDYLLGKNNTPADATQQEVNDLHRILEQGQLTYREEPVSEEAQNAVKTLLEAYYWKKGRNRVNHNKKDDKE